MGHLDLRDGVEDAEIPTLHADARWAVREEELGSCSVVGVVRVRRVHGENARDSVELRCDPIALLGEGIHGVHLGYEIR